MFEICINAFPIKYLKKSHEENKGDQETENVLREMVFAETMEIVREPVMPFGPFRIQKKQSKEGKKLS